MLVYSPVLKMRHYIFTAELLIKCFSTNRLFTNGAYLVIAALKSETFKTLSAVIARQAFRSSTSCASMEMTITRSYGRVQVLSQMLSGSLKKMASTSIREWCLMTHSKRNLRLRGLKLLVGNKFGL